MLSLRFAFSGISPSATLAASPTLVSILSVGGTIRD